MNTNTTAKPAKKSMIDVRKLVFTALLSAVSVVLMKYLGFHLPFIPAFLTFDFSDIPAVLAALTMGPVSGVAVCLIKNLGGFLLAGSMTGGVGEISNFILGVMLVVPAGIISHKTHSFKGVIISCVAGAFAMALGSIVTNYFFVYPLYTVVMPMEVIIGMYQAINPNVSSLIECLLMFNLPFTLAKGLIAVAVSIPLYKKLRPIFNSTYRNSGKTGL
ncbi:MAG: ECF transporter S component [Oscillospiraceae bacterium]